MKIIMVNYSEITSPGGVHKTILELAKNLSKKGHEIIVIQGNPKELPEEEIYDKFKIIRVKSKLADNLYGLSSEIYFYLKKNFKKLNPDIVHIHGYHTLFSIEIMYVIKKFSPNTPIIFSPHFGVQSHNTFAGKYFWNIYNQLIGKRIINYTDKFIVASNFEYKNLIRCLNIQNKKISIIPHGVNKIEKKMYKTKRDRINLLYVGYLIELKGVQFIIRAMNELINKNNYNAVLNIVGEGPYEHELIKMAKKFKLEDYIIWNNFISPDDHQKLLNHYKRADMLILLSKSENYGMVVIESLAMYTPVIITKNTALIEFLDEDGCFGVDYPPDPKKVADIILKIHKSNIQINFLSDKIRMWKDVTVKYENLYLESIRGIK